MADFFVIWENVPLTFLINFLAQLFNIYKAVGVHRKTYRWITGVSYVHCHKGRAQFPVMSAFYKLVKIPALKWCKHFENQTKNNEMASNTIFSVKCQHWASQTCVISLLSSALATENKLLVISWEKAVGIVPVICGSKDS